MDKSVILVRQMRYELTPGRRGSCSMIQTEGELRLVWVEKAFDKMLILGIDLLTDKRELYNLEGELGVDPLNECMADRTQQFVQWLILEVGANNDLRPGGIDEFYAGRAFRYPNVGIAKQRLLFEDKRGEKLDVSI